MCFTYICKIVQKCRLLRHIIKKRMEWCQVKMNMLSLIFACFGNRYVQCHCHCHCPLCNRMNNNNNVVHDDLVICWKILSLSLPFIQANNIQWHQQKLYMLTWLIQADNRLSISYIFIQIISHKIFDSGIKCIFY